MTQAKSDAKRSQLVPAVGYTRRSTDKQETSISEQTKAIQQYAEEEGYQILRWYTDDAISGDDTKKRHEFQRMMADAQQARDFKAILCWDQARFGRFDMIEAGYYIHPLREAGIHLATVVGGVVDWNESSGRIVSGVTQEGKHQQLRDHSANVARGQLEAMKNGGWVGSAPYAYRIEGEKKHKRLVIAETGKVRVVQRIFREFVDEGRSMRNIAERLQADGVMSPGGRGKPWRWDTVRTILENPAYCGDYAAGRQSYGKYNRIVEGRVEKVTARSRTENPKSNWIVHTDHHKSIIGRETFEKARAIFEAGKTGRARYKPGKNPYALTGLLRCGRCTCPMWGMPGRNGRQYYECGSRQYQRDSSKVDCEGTTVREDEILNELAEYLENWLGFADAEREGSLDMAAIHGTIQSADLPEAFDRVKKLVLPPTVPKKELKQLEKEAGELRTKIDTARRNLALLSDPANIPIVEAGIRTFTAALGEVEEKLKTSKPPSDKDLNALVLEVLRNLYCLATYCRALSQRQPRVKGRGRKVAPAAPVNTDPSATTLRRFLNGASHITVHTAISGSGRGTRHTFLRGEIAFRTVGVLAGYVNPRPLGPKPSALPG